MRLPLLTIPALCLSATLVFGNAPLFGQEAGENPIVELDTSEGKIVIELNAEKAPKSVANFLEYVESGHYAGTVFHRVMKDFMIQGGGFDETLREKPTKPPVANEGGNGLTNKKYTLAMARTNDPHSATCQFFINTGDKNGFLNRADPRSDGFGYAVFGKVIEGMEVVDKINIMPTEARPNPKFPAALMENVPRTKIVIRGAKLVSKAGAISKAGTEEASAEPAKAEPAKAE